MKKLMIPAIVAMLSVSSFAEDAKPAEATSAAAPAAATEAAKPAKATSAAAPAAATEAAKPAEGAADAKPAEGAAGACQAVVQGNDKMQFDIKEIKINKASCPEFTVELDHVGKMPLAVMGHNVVITKKADVDGVAQDGAKAAATNYVKEGDERVIAHTKAIGGGQKDSVTFKTDVLEAGGDYDFFCSFPGHLAIMRGKVIVE